MIKSIRYALLLAPLSLALGCGSEPPVVPPTADVPSADAALDVAMDAAIDVGPDAPRKPMPNIVPLVITGDEPWLAQIPTMIRTGYGFRAPRFENRTFTAGSCEVQEGCTLPGARRLLRFTLATPNRGDADLELGPPTTAERPDSRFEPSPCHNHWHLRGYADYRLLDSTGRIVARGHKQSFCIEDSTRDPLAPNNPATGMPFNSDLASTEQFTCTNQGLHAGWLDAYGQHLECQYIDITGVPAGSYRIRAVINSDRVIAESDYSDNSVEVPIEVTAPTGNPPPTTPLDACMTAETGTSRECGWTTEPDPRRCTPGEMTTVGCNGMCPGGGGICEGNTILRVCPSSRPCAATSAGCMPTLPFCTAAQAIGNNDDSCGGQCSQVTFMCPATGYYRVLTGAFRAGEGSTCRLPFVSAAM